MSVTVGTSEDDLVLRVEQQKDRLVQAVPFRDPDYEVEGWMYNNAVEENVEDAASPPGGNLPEIDIHDEDTMPSSWTPADPDNQLESFEPVSEGDESSEAEDTCEPSPKKKKTDNSQSEDETSNTLLNINLFISNNVTIHKPS